MSAEDCSIDCSNSCCIPDRSKLRYPYVSEVPPSRVARPRLSEGDGDQRSTFMATLRAYERLVSESDSIAGRGRAHQRSPDTFLTPPRHSVSRLRHTRRAPRPSWLRSVLATSRSRASCSPVAPSATTTIGAISSVTNPDPDVRW